MEPENQNQPQQTNIPPVEKTQTPLTPQTSPVFSDNFVPPAEPTIVEKPQKSNKVLYTVFAVIFIIALAFLMVIFIQNRLNGLSAPDFSGEEPIQVSLQDTGEDDEDFSDEGFVDCSLPFIRVVSPDMQDEVFMFGQTVVFDWESCGISNQLLDNLTLAYFDVETMERLGDFDLVCAGAVLDMANSSAEWVVPSVLDSQNYNCPLQQKIDFRDPFLFKFEISFASKQYFDASDNFFSVDISNYVFAPPAFADFPAEQTMFSRVLLLDASVSEVYQEQISPSFLQTPANFANFYRTFQLSCGPSCVAATVIVDFREGKIYQAPNVKQIITSATSRLFVAEDTSYEDLQERDALVSWYEFTEETKMFSLLEQKLCNVSGLPTNREYTDCIEL